MKYPNMGNVPKIYIKSTATNFKISQNMKGPKVKTLEKY